MTAQNQASAEKEMISLGNVVNWCAEQLCNKLSPDLPKRKRLAATALAATLTVLAAQLRTLAKE